MSFSIELSRHAKPLLRVVGAIIELEIWPFTIRLENVVVNLQHALVNVNLHRYRAILNRSKAVG